MLSETTRFFHFDFLLLLSRSGFDQKFDAIITLYNLVFITHEADSGGCSLFILDLRESGSCPTWLCSWPNPGPFGPESFCKCHERFRRRGTLDSLSPFVMTQAAHSEPGQGDEAPGGPGVCAARTARGCLVPTCQAHAPPAHVGVARVRLGSLRAGSMGHQADSGSDKEGRSSVRTL